MKSVISLMSRLSLRSLYAIGDYVIFPLLFYVVRYRRKLCYRNMRESFPEWTEEQVRELEKRFYHHFVDVIMEIVRSYRASEEEMQQYIQFANLPDIERWTEANGGLFFMLGHMGNWEWLASIQQWVSPGVKELNVYRKLKSEAMDKTMLMLRAKRGGACVEKQRILREMVRDRAEKQPVTIGLLSDQKPRPEVTRTWVDFLHQQTGFLDGGEVLGKKFGYPVFYLYVTRTQRGYYHVDMKTVSANPKESADGEITTTYARMLERNINEQPFLWLWTHNRWKWQRG